jgi:ATP-dependent DNA helicase PIF1
MRDLETEFGKSMLLIRTAPTGVAAFNVAANTIHATFHVAVSGGFKPMSGRLLAQVQRELADVRYMILDEKSMVGLVMWGQIDRRCREIWPARSHSPCLRTSCGLDARAVPFGGLNVVILGDYNQLAPVLATSATLASLPPPRNAKNAELYVAGSEAILLFQHGATLVRQQRQLGEDDDAIRLRASIAGVCTGKPTDAEVQTLADRTLHRLPPAERLQFATALHVTPTRKSVAEINSQVLLASAQPIVRVPARHLGGPAAIAANDNEGGLEREVCLALGAKVMLRRNLWTSKGLTNGTMGTIGAAGSRMRSPSLTLLRAQLTSATCSIRSRAFPYPPSCSSTSRPSPASRPTSRPTASRSCRSRRRRIAGSTRAPSSAEPRCRSRSPTP